jgi:hypothetical protein
MTPVGHRAVGRCHRSTGHAFVVRGALWTVADQQKSPWTVPELWKTQTARFPQLVGRRTERAAHNGPPALLCFTEEEQMRKMTRFATGGARP